jgi:hypothetical protein
LGLAQCQPDDVGLRAGYLLLLALVQLTMLPWQVLVAD